MTDETPQAQSSQLALQAVLHQTCVSALTLTRVPSLAPDQTLDDAAERMRQVSHGSALICRNGQLLGIITERDLLRLLAEDVDFDTPLLQYMTASPRTLSPSDRLVDAVRLMDQGGYRRLPVVDNAGCPTGLVDVKTVMTFLVEQVPGTVYNQASSDLLTVRNAEGA